MSHTFGPILALLTVIAIGTISYLEGQAYKKNTAYAEQSRSIVDQTEELVSLLTDAESGVRGFLLTGDPHYLEPYQAALPQINKLLGELSRPGIAFAGATDAASLRPLSREKLAALATGIDARRSGGIDTVLALVTNGDGHGRQAMEEIRTVAARVIDAENREFAVRSAAADTQANRTRLIVLLGIIGLAFLLLVSTRHVNRLVRTQEWLILDLGRAREKEARAKAEFETTLRSIGDAVISTDTAGLIQFMNPIAAALTGWTVASAVGRQLSEICRIVNESTRQQVEDPADIVRRSGVVAGLADHAILLAKDGREIPIDHSGAAIHDQSGAATGVVLVFRDVTQRRRAQRELEESEQRYRLLFDSNPEAMWLHHPDTLAFLMVNNAAIQRYGYTREEFLGMTLRDIRPPEDVPLLEADIRKGDGRAHSAGPWRHRKRDGSIIFAETAVHSITLGAISGRLVIAKDITERRRIEEQLRQSQKLEAVGHLAGGIAHDFNNLLTVIQGYAEMIHAGQEENSPDRTATEEILAASQRAASLTQQLLAFSRRQVLQLRRINLNPRIVQTQKMLARLLGEDIQIVTRLAPDLRDVLADPGQIDQIVLNLSVNARDAMEHGGTLTIETSNVDFTEEEAAPFVGMAPGHYLRLSIADTGHGMDEETRRHIFEPFFTTKELGRGTGLGLSTVYGIIKQTGGAIAVYSEPGVGTTFTIYLPSAASADLEAPEAAAPPPSRQACEAVLVVEDDDTLRRLVVAMLTNLGYVVLKADTPEEALRLCANPAIRIDLLLADMVLPHSDGAAVAQQAALHRPNLKVLLMSGYTEHAVLRRHALDQQTPLLQKPFTESMLGMRIRKILDVGSENSSAAG
ncbi:MAG TPA: PAS domain S-box protein [Candidatus Acidoferrales bacterium]|jgi:two-component system cell cycle sensor histidine kinase/response regulator CckA|nr:PAS domain S-box protein [Candidatus Acidoferrales bacterium]